METDFEKHYAILDIDYQCEWPDVQRTYRRLVLRWHPDRQHHSSKNPEMVERRFIELTQSYNALRDYYKQNKRLPLTDKIRLFDVTAEDAVTVGVETGTGTWRTEKRNKPVEPTDLKSKWLKYAYVGCGLTMLIGAVGLMIALDRDARHRAAATAMSEITSTAPSPFSVDPDKVSKAEAKGAFISADPLEKPLGNQSKSGVFSD